MIIYSRRVSYLGLVVVCLCQPIRLSQTSHLLNRLLLAPQQNIMRRRRSTSLNRPHQIRSSLTR